MKDAKTIMLEAIERWNAHDRDGFLALCDEAITYVDEPSGQEVTGRDEFGKMHFDRWMVAYPDNILKDTVVFAEGDRVCFQGRFAGTHTGIFRGPEMELPPTGKPIDGPFVFIAEIRDGKVKSSRLYYDRLRVLEEEEIVTVEKLFAQLPAGHR